jgi:hypothetical protein
MMVRRRDRGERGRLRLRPRAVVVTILPHFAVVSAADISSGYRCRCPPSSSTLATPGQLNTADHR